MGLFLLIWLSVVGSCIGSFLNVVVYRLPRRRSLVYPGSACPVCGHAIRWYHNLPVLGWLLLRGKCFDCGTSISPRYPLVEAIVALLFLMLAVAGPLAGILPQGAFRTGWPLPDREEWILFAYLAFFFGTLLALAIIEFDGNPDGAVSYPFGMLVLAIAVGIVVPLFAPAIHPVNTADRYAAFADAAWGGVAGLVLGLASLPAVRLGPMGRLGRPFALGNAVLAGVYLGWLPVAILCAASGIVRTVLALIAGRPFRDARFAWTVPLLPLAVALVVLMYPPCSRFPWQPATPWAALATVAAAAGVVLVTAVVRMALAPRRGAE